MLVRIVILEDNPADAELILYELRRAGIDAETIRVIAREDFEARLNPPPDAILSDYHLPLWDGLQALRLVRERGLDVPFILVSGTIGEEHAVEAMRHGADDYLLKDRLTRLGPALTQALEKKRLRGVARSAQASIERLAAIVEYSDDAIIGKDLNGIITSWNRGAEKLFRYSSPEMIGQSILKLVPPDRHHEEQRILEQISRGETVDHFETVRARNDGRLIDVSVTTSPIKDAAGRITGASKMVRDITQRKLAAKLLQESAERLALAVQASNIGLWDWDLQTNEVHFSAQWKNQIGYRDDEIADRYEEWDSRIHPEDKPGVLAKLNAALKEPWPRYQIEFRFRHKDGSYRWIYVDAELIRSDDGKPLRILGCHLDVTERRGNEEAVRQNEAKYRGLIEQASDGIFVSDAEGNFLVVNNRGCELLGYTRSELIGLNGKVTYLEEEKELHSGRMKAAAAGQVMRFERMVRRKDGTTFPAEVSIKMLDDGTIQVIFHDITTRRSQERKIARLSRIHEVLSGINSAIVRIRDRHELFKEACRIAVEHGQFRMAWIGIVDRETKTLEPKGYAGFEDGFLAISRLSVDEALPEGQDIAGLAIRQKAPIVVNDINRDPKVLHVKEQLERGYRSSVTLPLIVGDEALGLFALYSTETEFFDDDELKLLTELAGDISFGLEYIAKEEKVDYLAYYDVLTGLPNRSLFFDRLTHQISVATRDRSNVALVLMDLDRFRLVNDTLGRHAGDALLKLVAQRLKGTLRDQDTVARVGSDAFAVAVSSTGKMADIAHLLETRNKTLFDRPFLLGQEELRVTATGGIAVFPGDGDNSGVLFANAEAALRQAKQQNARFLFYSADMNARVADSLRLESKLRQALESGEMVLWYQPKVSVGTRKIIGFEALMRWQDPESGMVPPARFIPLMEQTGLIVEAGRWALFQVARDCGLWGATGIKPPRVAVNVSPIQIRQKDFIATVVEAAARVEETGASLDLEITESTIMEHVETIIPLLQTVRGLGVEIAVDDFGTGYSSLAYIARLPIHDLKIDRTFVVGMTESEDSRAIVKSIISLAHSLRLTVVAEGVETEEQAALLLELGCDQMQGYLFSRPVPPQEVPDLLRRQDQPTQIKPAEKAPASSKKRPPRKRAGAQPRR